MKAKIILALLLLSVTIVKAQWQYVGLSSAQGMQSLAVDGSTLYAGAQLGLYKTTNNASSWSLLTTGITNVHAIKIIGSDIFIGTTSGVYKSSNNGSTWTLSNNGLSSNYVSEFGVIGTNIFAGTYTGGMFLSTNNGNSWSSINTGLTNLAITSLAIAGNNIYAGTSGNGIFLSTNNGNNWLPVNSGITHDTILSLAVNGSNLYAGTEGGGIYISTNNGTSWSASNNGLQCDFALAFAFSLSDIYAAGCSIYLTTNNGITWTDVNTGVYNLWRLIIQGTDLYAACESGVWKRPLAEMTGISENIITHETTFSPNPFSNELKITTDFNNPLELIIYDVTSRKIMQHNFTKSTILTTEQLSKGIYIYEIKNEKEIVQSGKVIKD